jgi:predicted SAM-dependent methyltransferase
MSIKKINLGCGLQCPADWINIDSSFGVKVARSPFKKLLYALLPKSILPNVAWPKNAVWMDITKPFSFESNSIDHVYSSHTLEHLSYEETAFVLKESYRVLKPGGVIRIIVPSLDQLVSDYLANKTANPENAAQIFHQCSLYFEIPYPKSITEAIKFYFKSKNNHKFLYDLKALEKQFRDAGFRDIKQRGYADSDIPGIKEIDIESRFNGAICLEAKK